MGDTRKRRAFGRLRELPSKRWQAAYIGPDAILYKADRTFPTRSDAELWLSQERRRIDLGVWVAPSDLEESKDVTISAYFNAWLDASVTRLRPRTVTLYRGLLDQYIVHDLGDYAVTAITPAAIRKWYGRLPADRPTRRAHAYSLARTIFNSAVDDGLVPTNPCRIKGAGNVDRAKDIHILEPAELRQFVERVPGRLQAGVLLAAWCGLRFGELTELRRKDFADDYAVVKVRRAVSFTGGEYVVGEPKTKAGVRDVAIPEHVAKALREHAKKYARKGPNGLMFPAADGGHLPHHQLRYHVKVAGGAIGKPDMNIHGLRHTGAVLAARSGATTAELMRRIGHSTPNASMRYQHAADERDALLAKRLGELAGE
ncbi:tyrosine-type recombinase/integrase [Nocardiaceae bacterium NPDC056970]